MDKLLIEWSGALSQLETFILCGHFSLAYGFLSAYFIGYLVRTEPCNPADVA